MAVGLFQEFRLADRGSFASIARTAEMGILKVTHRHTHAAAETEIGAWVDVAGMGCGEDRGEGLGIGICVGMGIGNDKVGRGVGNGVGCEGGQDMGQSNDPNLIFEGDFHPMPSGGRLPGACRKLRQNAPTLACCNSTAIRTWEASRGVHGLL